MDVSRPYLVAASLLISAIVSPFSIAQPGHSNYESATHQSSAEPQNSFLDFSLKSINPSNTNYGECISEGRSMVLEETVRNAYFWSNIVALGMLGCLFIVIVYQHRVQTKREWMSAEMFAQLEQSLARSNAQIEQVTEKNRALTESLATLKLAAKKFPPNPAGPVDRPPSHSARSHTAVAQASVSIPPKRNGEKPTTDCPPPVAGAPVLGGQIALFKPEVELVTKVNSLEQQLGRSHETEKHLRRQLNEAGRKLQAEQERNRSVRVEQTS
jgi:hypothetical protein